jgi:lipid A 3-O-deacylase
MKTKYLLATSFLGATLALASTPALALDLSVAAGVSGHGDAVLRAGISSTWNKQWFVSNTGHLGGYWDAAYTYWEGGNRSASAHSLSFSPVLTYTFTGPRLQPFIEGGIGIAAFSKTRVNGRNLGSSFNFEDRLGAGITLPNQGKLGIRFTHYSNAGIKQPNDGIDSYSLFYRHPL